MHKKLLVLAMVVAFTAASSIVAYSFTCKVTAVDGGTVTLNCNARYAKKLAVGNKVKVRIKKRRVVEGC